MNSLLKKLKGKRVGLDTMCFIYAFEEHPKYLPAILPLFEKLERGEFHGITSTVSLAEILVRPFEVGDLPLIAKYRMLFRNFPNLEMLPVTFEVAEKAAELRAAHKIRTPDAMHLATSLVHGASFFISNDTDLSKVEGMSLILLDDLVR